MIRNIYILLLFALSFGGTVTDIDGNVYETVQIGEQLWMAENLKVTHYSDGSEILYIQSDLGNQNWANYSIGMYTIYNNHPPNAETFGYQGFTHYSQYMNTIPAKYEEDAKIIPNKILTIGKAYKKLKKELHNLLLTYLEDNCFAWNMDQDGNYQKRRPDEFKKYSQFELIKKSS